MPAPLGELGVDEFLADYWQKQPCLIRDAWPGFTPELDGDDLAGLACEPLAEARLISGSYPEHDWRVRHGPFDERVFEELPETNWTLLVQDVEKHYPPLFRLLERFDFLPTWRIDDLMVSYAAPGGSVGPHVDQYDVFLLQSGGRRRWQAARRFDASLRPDCPFDVLERFRPEQEWVLEPGDMLYLPPDVAHHGVALEPGMTWSIGLRAPDVADLLMALGEELAATGTPLPRYADPDPESPPRPGEVDRGALQRVHRLMREPLDNERVFRNFVAQFLSGFRLAHHPAAPEAPVTAEEVDQAVKAGTAVLRNPWTRLAWVEQDGRALLFAAGERFYCSVALAESLCARQAPAIDAATLSGADRDALAGMLNSGHLVLGDE